MWDTGGIGASAGGGAAAVGGGIGGAGGAGGAGGCGGGKGFSGTPWPIDSSPGSIQIELPLVGCHIDASHGISDMSLKSKSGGTYAEPGTPGSLDLSSNESSLPTGYVKKSMNEQFSQ